MISVIKKCKPKNGIDLLKQLKNRQTAEARTKPGKTKREAAEP